MRQKGKAGGSQKKIKKRNMAKRKGQEVLKHYQFKILPTFQ